jgi:heat-inducible transcriptional repressor
VDTAPRGNTTAPDPVVPGPIERTIMSRASQAETRVQTLSDRERTILRLVVQSFVDTAGPIGSRFLSANFDLGLSPASIRNTMNELEARGFLDHPYTSAGRIPTERGYRAYVDGLTDPARLSPKEQELVRSHIDEVASDTESLVRESSRLIGQLANLLGVALSPRIATGIMERLEIVPLSSTRLMFVISVKGGLIRTIIMHADSELSRSALDRMVSLLNERLAGLTLEEIRRTCQARVRDLRTEETGVVRLIMDETSMLFSEPPETRQLELGGTGNILSQPEFRAADELRDLVSLLDDEAAVVRLLEDQSSDGSPLARAEVRIGSENMDRDGAERVKRYSVVTAPYQRASMRGTIGVIGPMRMDYARVIAVVEGMAALLSWSPDAGEQAG